MVVVVQWIFQRYLCFCNVFVTVMDHTQSQLQNWLQETAVGIYHRKTNTSLDMRELVCCPFMPSRLPPVLACSIAR